MPSGAISGDSSFAYASGLLIPVVDTTQPAGSRNGKMTLGALATAINSQVSLASGSNISINSGTVAVVASPSFTGVTAGTIETSDAIITGGSITGLPTPSATSDAATKSYVDASVQGLQIKPTAALATAAALPSNTYSNGSAGVGATLTGTADGALAVDGVAVTAGALVLVKNETTGANNGLYVVTATGSSSAVYVLTRHTGMETSTEFSGAFVPVGSGGTANSNTLWLANPSGTVTVGTTAIPFTQLNAATSYVSGTGITVSGGTVSLSTITNNTVWGNVSGGTATPSQLTPAQLTTLVNTFTPSLSGAVPASGGGTTNYLRADGTWDAPPGTSSGAALSGITAATGANTIANGNNPQVWNWVLSSATEIGFKLGETTAATGGAGSQFIVGIATLSGSTAGPLQISAQGSTVMTVDPHGALTYQPVTSSGVGGYSITLTGGAAPSGYTGGSVSLIGGSSVYTGGTVYITGGATTGGGAVTTGGVVISSGSPGNSGPTGSISISTPNGNSSGSGSITLQTGTGNSATNAGNIYIIAGNQGWDYGAYTGGSINFTTGNSGSSGSWGNAGDFNVTLGTSTGGRNGVFKITSLQTADPSVTGALYVTTSGRLAVSGNVPLEKLCFMFQGTPAASAVYSVVVPYAMTLQANFAGTVVYDSTQATANAVFAVNHISGGTTTPIGTLTITPSSHTSVTLSTQAAVTMAAGDVLQLVAPSSPDATLANLAVTMLAYRT